MEDSWGRTRASVARNGCGAQLALRPGLAYERANAEGG